MNKNNKFFIRIDYSFYYFILEQIHKELKEPIKGFDNNINVITFYQYDKNNSFNTFY
jgi:hypothetical protein